MADSALIKSGTLSLDYSIYELDVDRGYRATVFYDKSYEGFGSTRDIALNNALSGFVASQVEKALSAVVDAPQEGTRNLVGNDVTSEQLADAYLGKSQAPTERGSNG